MNLGDSSPTAAVFSEEKRGEGGLQGRGYPELSSHGNKDHFLFSRVAGGFEYSDVSNRLIPAPLRKGVLNIDHLRARSQIEMHQIGQRFARLGGRSRTVQSGLSLLPTAASPAAGQEKKNRTGPFSQQSLGDGGRRASTGQTHLTYVGLNRATCATYITTPL